MYLLLRPDKPRIVQNKPFWANDLKAFPEFRLHTQQNGIGLTLQYWFAEGNQWQAVAYVEFFYKTSPEGLQVFGLDLTVQSMPAFLDREVIVGKMLALWHKVLGAYTIEDFSTPQKLPFGTSQRQKRRTTTLLSATLSEGWQLGTDIGKKIEGNLDVAAVLRIIKPLPKPVQPYFLSLYLRRLVQRQQLTNDIIEKIFSYGLQVCSKYKTGDERAFGLYNLVLYYKHLKASLLANLSTEFITQKYLPFVLSLPGELELTQIVWLDLFLYFLDLNNTELYGDILTTLVTQSKQHHSLFVPEMKTLLRQHQKGNIYQSLLQYYTWHNRSPWQQLREQYRAQHTGSSIMSDFESNVIEQSYIPKLSLWQKLNLIKYRPLWKQSNAIPRAQRTFWERFSWIILLLLVIAAALARMTQDPGPRSSNPPTFQDHERITLTVKDAPIHLEAVTTAASQARGLMYRTYLPADEGMLFVYNEPRQGGFWMKNTLIPLDIIFLDSNGTIVDIKARFEPCPTSLGDNCPTYKPAVPYQYAIELAGGTARTLGLQKNDQIDLNK